MKFTKFLLLFTSLGLATSSPAFAVPIVDAFLTKPTPNPDTVRTEAFPQAGFSFWVNAGETQQVNSLGFWVSPDNPGSDLAINHEIALYKYNGTSYTQIASATVLAGSTADSTGYAWVSIPTLTLTDIGQGADYYVVTASVGTDIWGPNTGVSNATVRPTWADSLTLYRGVYAPSAGMPGVGNTIVGSGNFINVSDNTGYIGANIGFFEVVPEPSSLTLLLFGMAGIWRMRKRRK